MDDKKLNNYLDAVGRRPLLTAEQEQQLSVRIGEGDERALNRLVECNLRLVVATAARYQGHGLSMDDLVSEGNMGLMKAARKYDGSRGVRFAAYASPLIVAQIEKALKAESEATKTESQRSSSSLRSVDAPLGTKTNMSLLSVLVDGNAPLADERTYSSSAEAAAERALQSLSGREAQVVAAYFGIGQESMTMAEIATDMGLKRERVRQIRNRAVRRMKKVYRAER